MRNFSIKSLLVVTGITVASLFGAALCVAVFSINDAYRAFSLYVNKEQALLSAYSEMYAQGLQMGQAIRRTSTPM